MTYPLLQTYPKGAQTLLKTNRKLIFSVAFSSYMIIIYDNTIGGMRDKGIYSGGMSFWGIYNLFSKK
jgi:hypothetical protein